MNLHSVLLQIATQSLTIGECNYFGSHNSDIRNDPGRVRSPHANVWTGLSVHVSASSVHSCSAGGRFFGIKSL